MKTNDWNSLHDLRRPLMCGLARPVRGRATRRGLTLTEILVASFVLAFGLTAVLTVLPFGAFQLNRMNVADMSGACGRGALQQIRMAEWQKPGNVWVGNGIINDFSVPNFYGAGSPEQCQIADPFIVDPLGLDLEKNFSSPPAGASVYQYMNGGNPALGRTFPVPVSADRSQNLCVMSIYDPQNNLYILSDAANQFFRWSDDTIFAGEEGLRPELVTRSDGLPSVSGEFTWLYMITPKVANTGYYNGSSDDHLLVRRHAIGTTITDIAWTPYNNVTGYEVAAVVFHRRDLYPEPLDVSTGSSAPGENQYRPIRRLNLGNCTINTTGAYVELQSKNAEDLDLTSIKWILLSGVSQELHDFGNGSLNAQWYRITGSDDIQGSSGNFTRRVFLVGPDWKGAKDASGNLQGNVYAILCDGVVNVFQATMPK